MAQVIQNIVTVQLSSMNWGILGADSSNGDLHKAILRWAVKRKENKK